MSFHMDNPTISRNVFTNIMQEINFAKFVKEQFEYTVGLAHWFPHFSDSLMHDAYQSWHRDITRMPDDSMQGSSSEPDHFKNSGVLAYWLRRFPPAQHFTDNTKSIQDSYPYSVMPRDEEFRELLRGYVPEYLAFDIGFRICDFFETQKKDSPCQPKSLSDDYIKMACHFLKYKNVSPHSMILMYKSLYE